MQMPQIPPCLRAWCQVNLLFKSLSGASLKILRYNIAEKQIYYWKLAHIHCRAAHFSAST